MIASRIASLVNGTAPKENYGGRVMCFLETGNGQATSLRFDYEHPPVPPQPNRAWHMAKWMFNRMYWETVPQGRIPGTDRAPARCRRRQHDEQDDHHDPGPEGLVLPDADREDRAGDP